MNFFPDITPLTNKITEFTQTQKQTQQEIIALLEQIHLELTQINQKLENK